MRIILLFALCLSGYSQILSPIRNAPVAAGGGTPTITRVQACVNSAVSATVNCVMGSNIASGNLLVVTSKTGSATVATPVITSSAGVACTWNTVATSTNVLAAFTGTLGYCNIPSGGAETVTLTWSGPVGTFTDIAVAEYHTTNTWVSPALDVSANLVNSTPSTTCSSGTSGATSNANDLVVGLCECFNSAQTWGAATGYTNYAAASRNTTGWYDKVVTSTGTQSFSTTIISDISWGIVAAFKSN